MCDDHVNSDSEHLLYYDMFAGKVRHEDTLINQRTLWFITLQSLLFTSSALILHGETSKTAGFFIVILGVIGIAACVTTHLGVRAALRSIEATDQKWVTYMDKERIPGELRYRFPALKGGGFGQNLAHRGSLSSIWLPRLIGVAWLFTVAFVWWYLDQNWASAISSP